LQFLSHVHTEILLNLAIHSLAGYPVVVPRLVNLADEENIRGGEHYKCRHYSFEKEQVAVFLHFDDVGALCFWDNSSRGPGVPENS